MPIKRILQITCLSLLTACNTIPSKTDRTGDSGATANNQAKEQTPASKKAADVKALDKVVCRTETPVGSRIGTRVCLTRRRWIELSRQSQKALDDAHRSAVVSPIPRAESQQK